MKIASFNVENLFDRAKAFNDESDEAKEVVTLEAELNTIFRKPVYTQADKDRMLEIMKATGILKSDNGPYLLLRKIRGALIKRPRTGNGYEIVASGRGDWVGWAELKTAHVNDIAIMNTGRVLKDVNADILAVIEAEHRVALKQFSDFVLRQLGGQPYENVMLIDGNDDRGIDVGLMTRSGYHIGLMKSHIHDLNGDGEPVFSRDCPEYCVTTPDGSQIWILPNHFKSKFGGNDPRSQAKRKLQGEKTAEIYNHIRANGAELIVVLGDLNDTPDSEPIQALVSNTDLKEITNHPTFDTGKYNGKGTFDAGRDNQKIDYLFLSPKLYDRVTASGIFRRGAWPGERNPKWDVYPELQERVHAASDHHLIWCEIL
jgi:endonuclease/exonuclease/phosphatase family metal-dependent hydrolase